MVVERCQIKDPEKYSLYTVEDGRGESTLPPSLPLSSPAHSYSSCSNTPARRCLSTGVEEQVGTGDKQSACQENDCVHESQIAAVQCNQ